MPAEVATAWWIGLPCRVSAIVANEPPLMPIRRNRASNQFGPDCTER
jgi:hypothetical protein